MKNRIAYFVRKGKIEVKEGPMPAYRDDEVLIRVCHCGVCGSDVHNYIMGGTGRRVIQFPFILGHELAGVVAAVGSKVTNLKIGDRVCVEPGVPCGKCEWCKKGEYNLCPDVQFMSAYPVEGAMRDYVAFRADYCFRLPENVDTMEGALVEPFAVGLYAATKAQVCCGDTVLILGSGCIGLMSLLACKAMGASRVVCVDIFDKRLEMAKKIGADFIVNSSRTDVEQYIAELTGGRMADIVMETAGNAQTIALAPMCTKRGGKIIGVGMLAKEISYNFFELNSRELTLISTFRYRNVYPLALELLSSGKVSLKAIQPRIFPLEEADDAFQCAINDAKSVVKCVISMEDGEGAV